MSISIILTRRGWERARHERRVEQRRFLQTLASSFSCWCIQCYCGGMELVIAAGVTFCRQCGKPREILRTDRRPNDPKEYVKPGHVCSKKSELLNVMAKES